MVDIVIPIYRKTPNAEDLVAINRAFSVLKDYDITFVHPQQMDISNYLGFVNAKFIGFDDFYFKNIEGYNQLMLNKSFYEKFQQKFILIYQTDAFVFRDDLQYWCEKDYDYIGAPWIRSQEKIPFSKLLWERSLYFMKKWIDYKGNKKIQKDKSLIYNEVGNGGFSLRKREKCIAVLEELPEVVKLYLKPSNKGVFYAEDVFFSVEPKRNGLLFSKPKYKEACRFAIENKQEVAMEWNRGELPFGCHRWHKEKDFWRTYFAQEGCHI